MATNQASVYPRFLPIYLGKEFVTLVVGSEDEVEEFHVHKDLLCNRSPFFNAAFNGSFEEATTGKAALPEEDPMSFSYFIHWLYTSQLPPPEHEVPEDSPDSEPQIILRLFALGDKLLIPELQDLCWTWLRDEFGTLELPDANFFNDLYELTDQESPLRTYFVQLCTYMIGTRSNQDYCWDDVLNANETFAADVAKALARGLRLPDKERNIHPWMLTKFVHFKPDPTSGQQIKANPLISSLMTRIKEISAESTSALTFSEWPHRIPSARAMIVSGWIHKPSLETGRDRATCLYCGKSTFNWKPEHDPLERHRFWSPSCPYVIAKDSGALPIGITCVQ